MLASVAQIAGIIGQIPEKRTRESIGRSGSIIRTMSNIRVVRLAVNVL
jgi:hypothetical protein